MALKTVWCEVCRKPWRPKSRNEDCPNCRSGLSKAAAAAEDESGEGHAEDDPLVNTMAPPETPREIVERYGSGSRPVVIESVGEINCPECAERIKSKAKTCRFCGADVTEKGARERRRDRDADRGGGRGARRAPARRGGGGGFNECHCGGFRVTSTPGWVWVIVILFFPIGLLALLIKTTKCSRCGA